MKCEDEVDATATKALIGWRIRQCASVHFGEHMRFSNLPFGFRVHLEVYALVSYFYALNSTPYIIYIGMSDCFVYVK